MGRKGYKHTPEALAKISLASKTRVRSKETYIKTVQTRKRNGTNKHTEESKRKMSETRKGVPFSLEVRKKRSEYYKNKLRVENPLVSLQERIRKCFEYRLWRSDVYKNDNYTCQGCGDNRGGNLEADHKKPFIVILLQYNIKTLEEALLCLELWDINNGRTLCKDCHKKTDTYGTRAKFRT